MQEHICTVEILRTQQIRNQVEAAMFRTDLCGHRSGISAGYKALLLLTSVPKMKRETLISHTVLTVHKEPQNLLLG